MRKIKIIISEIEKYVILNNSPMAESLWSSLPIQGKANRWGDEIYFSIPVKEARGERKSVVEKGDVAFWPPGKAFCIFFGPTPISTEEEIRPASEVILLGKVEGDLTEFKKVKDGEIVQLQKV